MDTERHPRARSSIRKRELIGQHTGQSVRRAIEPHDPSDGVRISTEPLTPETLGHNHDRRLVDFVLLVEQGSDHRTCAEDTKQARRVLGDPDSVGFACPGERHRCLRPRREIGDRRRPIAPREVHRIGKGAKARRIASARFFQKDETITARPRQRLDQHSIGDAEQRRRRANSQRHRHRGEECESGLTRQQAGSVADVLHKGKR